MSAARGLAVVGAVAAAAGVAGCGGDDGDRGRGEPPARGTPATHRPPPRPLAAGPGIVESSPGWVQAFCREVARRSPATLCPRAVPAGLVPAEGVPSELSAGDAYVLHGMTDRLWTVAARAGGTLGAGGATTVHGRPARRLARGGRIALTWREGRTRYRVVAEGRDSATLRRRLRAVAVGMGPGVAAAGRG